MSTANIKGDQKHRGEMLAKIGDAIKPEGGLTREQVQAQVEALILVAAVNFLANHGVPGNRAHMAEISKAATNAFASWLEDFRRRN